MRKITMFILCASGIVCGAALATEVPGITPLDFVADTSAEASRIWLALAGEGFWGAIVVGVAGLAYKLLRPAIFAWIGQFKLEKLYLGAEACVAQVNAVYVEGMKKANADGKLTTDEKKFVFGQCKSAFIAFMAAQGVDVLKEYGDVVIDAVIELIVSRFKNPLVKAVAAPLPDLAP